MQNLKQILPVTACVLAVVFSAFTTRTEKINNGKITTQLHWFDVQSQSPSYDGELTKEDEMSLTSCADNSSLDCARGYTANQLVNGDPAQGPIDPDVYTDIIKKTN